MEDDRNAETKEFQRINHQAARETIFAAAGARLELTCAPDDLFFGAAAGIH